jgi:hypothetical protein
MVTQEVWKGSSFLQRSMNAGFLHIIAGAPSAVIADILVSVGYVTNVFKHPQLSFAFS